MSIVQSRKIGLHHIAFFRSFFEGSLDIRKMADRFLETGNDIVAARETLKMVQDAFVSAALRVGRDKEAQWLVLPASTYKGKGDVEKRADLERLKTEVPPPPDFNDWQDIYDPDGFFSERELLEVYSSTFAAEIQAYETYRSGPEMLPSRKIITAVDLTRRINLINELAGELVSYPRLTDSVHGWFSPSVAQRLSDAQLPYLEDLVNLANEHGFRWFRFVPKLGEKTARKLIDWLQENNVHFDGALNKIAKQPIRTIAKHSLVPTQSRYGITTLERLAVPHPLSGTNGTNRADLTRNKLSASNDYDAIHEWLGLYPVMHTFQSYRKEAERLLLWALCEKRKPLSSLTTADMNEFFLFLENPPEAWCSPKRYERYHENWRPFVRDSRSAGNALLSPRSIRQARAITSTLFGWLVSQQYLDSNPVLGLPETKHAEPIKIDHSFTKSQWQHVVRFLSAMPNDTVAQVRLKFLVLFGYGTGLRLHEIANAQLGHLKRMEFEDSDLFDVYMLEVLGKGKKLRTVPIPRMALTSLRDYLEVRGLSRQLGSNADSTPLVSSLRNSMQRVTNKTVYVLIKEFFVMVARSLDCDSEAHRRFLRASTHWLRHTYGSHAVNSAASLQTVQENMGHSSLNTTSLYIKGEDEQRWKEIDTFMESGFSS